MWNILTIFFQFFSLLFFLPVFSTFKNINFLKKFKIIFKIISQSKREKAVNKIYLKRSTSWTVGKITDICVSAWDKKEKIQKMSLKFTEIDFLNIYLVSISFVTLSFKILFLQKQPQRKWVLPINPNIVEGQGWQISWIKQ